MKKSIFVVLFLSAVCSVRAQEIPAVRPVENTNQEIFEMLRLLGARGYRFDLSAFTAGTYSFELYVEEYEHGQKVEGPETRLGGMPNWRPIFPDEAFPNPGDREKWLEGKTLSADGKQWLTFESLGLSIVPQKDSTFVIGYNFYGGMSGGFTRKLRPLENSDPIRYSYDCRPFKIRPAAEKQQRIPLLLYGSFWWDEKFNIHRFCAEREFEPDLSNESLNSVPHYYVIGLEVRELE